MHDDTLDDDLISLSKKIITYHVRVCVCVCVCVCVRACVRASVCVYA